MNQHQTEQELSRRMARLPREMAPANDQWSSIAARISARISDDAQTKRSKKPVLATWPLAIAASLLLVTALSFVLYLPGTETPGAMVNAESPPGEAGIPAGVISRTAADAEYLAAFREFMDLNASGLQTSSLAVNELGSGWSTLRQVEVELSAALAAEPDNPFLASRMNYLRARQLELLQSVAALDTAARRNSI